MTQEDAFWKIHEGLPRQGPGSDKTTKKLLYKANSKGNLYKAIDMGCGPGRSSLILASKGFDVTAIDTHQPFLEELRYAATAQGLENKIKIENISIDKVPYPNASFDLVWSEGTAYLIGWQKALAEWKRLLKPHGKLVVTDCFWLTNKRSLEVSKFWEVADPHMMSVKEATKTAANAGYSIDYTYVQPESDWWQEYYNFLEERIETLAKSPDPVMQEALTLTTLEIDVRRKYSNEYGHVGFVLSISYSSALKKTGEKQTV